MNNNGRRRETRSCSLLVMALPLMAPVEAGLAQVRAHETVEHRHAGRTGQGGQRRALV